MVDLELPTLNGLHFLQPDLGFAVGNNGTFVRYGTGTVGFDDLGPSSSITIAPNPVRDRLTISGDRSMGHAEVIDMTGRTVMRTTAVGSLDVSLLRPGCYLLLLDPFGADGPKSFRFLKE